MCVKQKAFLLQCECVTVGQACVLIPSHSTWTVFSPSKITMLSPAEPDQFVLIHCPEMACDEKQVTEKGRIN